MASARRDRPTTPRPSTPPRRLRALVAAGSVSWPLAPIGPQPGRLIWGRSKGSDGGLFCPPSSPGEPKATPAEQRRDEKTPVLFVHSASPSTPVSATQDPSPLLIAAPAPSAAARFERSASDVNECYPAISCTHCASENPYSAQPSPPQVWSRPEREGKRHPIPTIPVPRPPNLSPRLQVRAHGQHLVSSAFALSVGLTARSISHAFPPEPCRPARFHRDLPLSERLTLRGV